MIRNVLALTFGGMLLAGSAYAVPARLPYMPADMPKAPQAPPPFELRETSWQGSEPADRMIVFHADGTLSYTSSRRGGGSWTRQGNLVYFEINNRYREFRGTIDGNIIRGESWNVAGKRWQTELRPNGPVVQPSP